MSMTAAATAPSTVAESEEPGSVLIDIKPRSGWIAIDWKEIFAFRELLFFLIWRDVKVRYKQTVLGVAWALLQPLFNVILFTVVFGSFAGFSKNTSGVPYPLWVFMSTLPWQLVSIGITLGGMSLITSQNLLTKIYFPRIFVPAASVGGAVVDAGISFLCFLTLALYFGSDAHFRWTIVLVPVLMVPALMIALGYAYVFSALTVLYRDFRFVIPFFSMMMMYVSAVMIPHPNVKMHWRLLASINPMFGILDAFHSAAFGEPFYIYSFLISMFSTTVLFVFGLYYFRRTERRFADIA